MAKKKIDTDIVTQQKEQIEDTHENQHKRLTEKERKKVIAAYLHCMSYKAVGERYGLTPSGVKHIVNSDPDFAAKYRKQREKEAKELFGALSVKGKKFVKFCDVYFDLLADEQTIRELWKKDPEKVTRIFAINFDKMLNLDKIRVSIAQEAADAGDQNITINVIRKERKD